jgi:hypothetical protein
MVAIMLPGGMGRGMGADVFCIGAGAAALEVCNREGERK